MKKFLFVLVLMCAIPSNAQSKQQTLENNVSALQTEVRNLTTSQKTLRTDVDNTSARVNSLQIKCDSLQSKLNAANNELTKTKDELAKQGEALAETNGNLVKSTDDLNSSITSRTLYGAIGFAIALLVVAVIYFILRKKIASGESAIDTIKDAQSKLNEESVKLDNQLVEIMNKQLEVQKQSPQAPQPSGEVDHSLALKVADEIVRIELNLSRMDAGVKGHKQLSKAVERIKNNFLANGYEMVDMLGKPYNDGMKVVASFVSDENLKEGEQIITGITKPQVNYNGVMIQAAQITVSQNI